MKPGITGWAQIHGRAALPWAERIELDVLYVEHRTPLLDLKILARTPLALFRGTYKGDDRRLEALGGRAWIKAVVAEKPKQGGRGQRPQESSRGNGSVHARH